MSYTSYAANLRTHTYNESYSGSHLERIAFPLGGIGAGMFCIEGAGGFSNVSLRHRPEVFNDPLIFSAISFPDSSWPARVCAGPVAGWKIQFPWNSSAGNGGSGRDMGLPRFRNAEFLGRFPFGNIRLWDDALPLTVEIEGWSPFVPGNADESSLPVAAVTYTFRNKTSKRLDTVFSFHARNFMESGEGISRVRRTDHGFTLEQEAAPERPADAGAFSVELAEGAAAINPAWFRGVWFDSVMSLWGEIAKGRMIDRPNHPDEAPSMGGSISARLTLEPEGSASAIILTSWYVPFSDIRQGHDEPCCSNEECCCSDEAHGPGYYRPWYTGKFDSIDRVAAYWRNEYARLEQESRTFSNCFFDSTLPTEAMEAISANLSILKSPTVLRQPDGRLWAYEGSCDTKGCCYGSCTHVWNYAQALPHLFPELERSLRDTEFCVNQDEYGHQTFRTPLPIATPAHDFYAAADGQLGGIVKLYRDWRISGDTAWLKSLWPSAKQSLEYCITTWDPDRTGLVIEPHHNTYDIEFWGPDPMCTSIYLAALEAAARMADALEENGEVYRRILKRGIEAFESELFNGEYFIQDVRWEGLRAGDPTEAKTFKRRQYDTPEAAALLRKEGPKYQYGDGCLSDGVFGFWLGMVCGIDDLVDCSKVTSHLQAVHRYNFKLDLSSHANPQRPTYALGSEAGLLLCSWPQENMPTLPFIYSTEVWTGIEYQVAAHLIMCDRVTEGLEIVRACRDRYDGTVRNPFDEYECGHWYARALSSYSLLQALGGTRYDAVESTLYVSPNMPGNLRLFIAAQSGYGHVIIEETGARLEVIRGEIPVDHVEYKPYSVLQRSDSR